MMILGLAGHPVVAGAMEVMRFLLDGSLTEKSNCGKNTVVKSNNLAWTFLAGPDFQPVGIRTYSTLQKKVAEAIYFTPNTFFHRKKKTRTVSDG